MPQTDAKIGSILIVIIVGLIFIDRLFLSFSYYPDIGGLEHTFIYFVQKVSLNTPFFANPETAPYNLCQYAPAYFFICNKLARILGADPLSDVHHTYVVCRLLNLSLNILSSYIIFYILKNKLALSRGTATIFSLISFSLYYVHHYGVRPDSLKNTVLLLVLLLLYNATNTGITWRYLVVVLLAFFSGFIKQDAYVFVPIIFIFYWLRNDKKGIVISFLFFLCLTVCILIPFLSRPFCYQNLILGLYQGISIPYVLKMYQYLMAPRILFFILLFLFSIRGSFTKMEGGGELKLICLILFLSSFSSSLKWGATPSYFTEFFQLLLMIIAVNFDKTEKSIPSSMPYRALGLSLLTISLFLYESSVGMVRIYDQSQNEKFRSAYRTHNKIGLWIRQNSPSNDRFNVLSFDKPLINHLAARSVFPTYETEFPEYMLCGSQPFPTDNRPNIFFKYEQFKVKFALDSIDYFITAQPGCDTVFLGVDLVSKKQKVVNIDNYYVYMR